MIQKIWRVAGTGRRFNLTPARRETFAVCVLAEDYQEAVRVAEDYALVNRTMDEVRFTSMERAGGVWTP